MESPLNILTRLVTHVRDTHDQGAYDLANEDSDGKYKTWQSKRLKNLIAEADVIIANTPTRETGGHPT